MTINSSVSTPRAFNLVIFLSVVEDTAFCTSAFLNQTRIRELVGTANAHTNEQWIFPDINFTCSGHVTEWIVGASNFNSNQERYPELQVWRQSPSDPNIYDKVGGTTISPSVESQEGIYVTALNADELQFEKGDVLGVFLQQGGSRIRLLFENNAGPTSYFANRGRNEDASVFDPFKRDESTEARDLPLVAIAIGKFSANSCGSLHTATGTVTKC